MIVPAEIDISAWVTLLVLVLLPGVVATIFWSPMLASKRLRALFRHLPITDSTVMNYVLTALVLSIPWLIGIGWVFQQIGAQDGANGAVFLTAATLIALVYIIGLPLVAGFGLPRLGIDWDPANYSVGTWAMLLGSSLWYSLIFTVPMFLFGIIMSLPF